MSVYQHNGAAHPPKDDKEKTIGFLSTTTALYLTIYAAPALTNLTWPWAEHMLVDAYGYEVKELGFFLHAVAIALASFCVLKLLLRGAIALILTATGKYSWDFFSDGIQFMF